MEQKKSIKNNNTNKKSIVKILIIIVVILLLLLGAVLVYVATDLFKTEKTVFFKYLTQIGNQENGFFESDIVEYYKNLESRPHQNEGKILISTTLPEDEQENYEILAITACPTGIAHTYMAAESLEQMGNELKVSIKVETQGQSGAKNILTDEEIKNAKAIIIAADVNVDLSRFDGKRLLKTSVSDGIRKPKELIEKALNSEIPVYHHKEDREETGIKEKRGGNVYKHLMNGVTHMLPFVVGGGILIAISFLLVDYSINPSNFGMNTPIAAFFKIIGSMAFDFMLLILAGYIAMSIGDRPRTSSWICWWSNCKSRNDFYII